MSIRINQNLYEQAKQAAMVESSKPGDLRGNIKSYITTPLVIWTLQPMRWLKIPKLGSARKAIWPR